jgi:tetratricopeptide (TPR) repeat protein
LATDQLRSADAEARLDSAIDLLRRVVWQEHLAQALLARAELRRKLEDFDRAQSDLDEVLALTTRTGMRLWETEYYLEYTRLAIDSSKVALARAALDAARDLIHQLGYNRRTVAVIRMQDEIDRLSAATQASSAPLTAEDALRFVFRLVLDRRAEPDMLLNIDPLRLPESLGGLNDIRSLDAQLAERYGLEPNALWMAWVRALREQDVATLTDRLNHDNVQSDAR